MGIDINYYRAAVGAFYAVTHSRSNLVVFNLNIPFYINCVLITFCLLGCISIMKNDEFSQYKLILLIICMDVHLNPGPSSIINNSLDILHLNTRSIRNKLNYIQDLAESFHILCFSETHLDSTVDSLSLNFDGFNEPIRKDRTQNGGGVMVYLSSALKYKRRTDLENPLLETIWVEIKLKSFDILLCCLYRSDFVVSPSNFITELQSSVEDALDFTPYVILTGDINIDFQHITNVYLRDFLSLYNLKNIIYEPTRVIGNASTLIDPCIVTDVCTILDSGIIEVDHEISDHRATHVSVKIDFEIPNSYYREVWNYNRADFEKLNSLIEHYDWNTIFNSSTNIDDICEKFTNTFINFCKNCIPCKKILISANDKPWFSTELRYNMRIRDRLRKKYLKSNSISHHMLYKKQRNKVNNMKKYAKDNYMNNLSDIVLHLDSGNTSRSFWQLMGRFMGKSGSSICIPPLHVDDSSFAFSDEEKTELLNNHFCSISSIDDSTVTVPHFISRTEAILSNIKVLPSEVEDVLNNLKLNKASGPDKISHRMLKYTSKTISIPLSKLFNLS